MSKCGLRYAGELAVRDEEGGGGVGGRGREEREDKE